MKKQSGLKINKSQHNPEEELFGIYSGTVTGYVYSIDRKIVGLQVELQIKGPIRQVVLSTPNSGQFAPPQIKDSVLIAFVDGQQANPVLMNSLYPLNENFYGSDPKEAFMKLPNSLQVISDKDGNTTIKTDGNIKIQNPSTTQLAARKGDKTAGHLHAVPYHVHITPSGPTTAITWTPTPGQNGQTDTVKDTIDEGSPTVKIGD